MKTITFDETKFKLGDRVTKIRGSSWTGKVVGCYCTMLTPIGYAVESDTEIGSVQIYPENALKLIDQYTHPFPHGNVQISGDMKRILAEDKNPSNSMPFEKEK